MPLQPLEVHGSAEMPLQPVDEPTREQVDVPGVDCDPMGAGSWHDLWTHREREAHRFAGRICDPVGATLKQFAKNCSLWEGLFMKNCLL